MDRALEWTGFVGANFALMGVSLAAGAARRAKDAVAWECERRRVLGQATAAQTASFYRLQLWLNRACGAAGILAGAFLLGSSARGRAWGRGPSGLVGALLALVLLAAALAGAAAQAFSRGRSPRFLPREPASAPPPSERAVEACSWVLRALWAAYGFRLLWGLRR